MQKSIHNLCAQCYQPSAHFYLIYRVGLVGEVVDDGGFLYHVIQFPERAALRRASSYHAKDGLQGLNEAAVAKLLELRVNNLIVTTTLVIR